jgi:hypothetical protein
MEKNFRLYCKEEGTVTQLDTETNFEAVSAKA